MSCRCREFVQHPDCPAHPARLPRPDFGRSRETTEVTVEYKTELQRKADSLTAIRRWLDAAARCGATTDEMRRLADILDRKYGPLCPSE